MSEEKPRLSRREMREQGLLNAGSEDTSALRGDLQTRTSELQLRRPSRREMRLQREANEAKVAEQSAKFNAPTPTVGSQPEASSESRAVHSFNLSGATSSTPSATSDLAKRFSMPANTGAPALDEPKEAKAEQDVPLSTPPAAEPDLKKDEKPAASTGRSSLFDRFTSKDDDAISFRDRLVARTREGQREARESQVEVPATSADVPQEQSSGLGDFFGFQSSQDENEAPAQIDKTTVEELSPVVDNTIVEPAPEVAISTVQESEKAPSLEVEVAPAPKPEPEPEPAPEPERTPISEPTPEDIDDETEGKDEKAGVVADKAKEKVSRSDFVESKDLVKDSTAVAEAGRYPTDVSMRLTDDDEEKTGGDRLVSLLIILVGVLIGVVLGLIVQNLIFGTQGIDMDPVYYVQAASDSYGIGS